MQIRFTEYLYFKTVASTLFLDSRRLMNSVWINFTQICRIYSTSLKVEKIIGTPTKSKFYEKH